MGLSFCAIWYKALIAFMLNSGGFLSATNPEADYIKDSGCLTEKRKYERKKEQHYSFIIMSDHVGGKKKCNHRVKKN